MHVNDSKCTPLPQRVTSVSSLYTISLNVNQPTLISPTVQPLPSAQLILQLTRKHTFLKLRSCIGGRGIPICAHPSDSLRWARRWLSGRRGWRWVWSWFFFVFAHFRSDSLPDAFEGCYKCCAQLRYMYMRYRLCQRLLFTLWQVFLSFPSCFSVLTQRCLSFLKDFCSTGQLRSIEVARALKASYLAMATPWKHIYGACNCKIDAAPEHHVRVDQLANQLWRCRLFDRRSTLVLQMLRGWPGRGCCLCREPGGWLSLSLSVNLALSSWMSDWYRHFQRETLAVKAFFSPLSALFLELLLCRLSSEVLLFTVPVVNLEATYHGLFGSVRARNAVESSWTGSSTNCCPRPAYSERNHGEVPIRTAKSSQYGRALWTANDKPGTGEAVVVWAASWIVVLPCIYREICLREVPWSGCKEDNETGTVSCGWKRSSSQGMSLDVQVVVQASELALFSFSIVLGHLVYASVVMLNS